MRQGLLQFGLFSIAVGIAANAVAQEDRRETSLLPSFKLTVNKDFLSPKLSSTLIDETGNPRMGYSEARSNHYDAIFYYPLHRQGVSIDLGVNIRLQGAASYNGQAEYQGGDWLSIDPKETRTRIHAAAVFDLPFDGLQAGVSGSYEPSFEKFDYDYQAKLSYKWKNGFGLEGGWQHQQKPLEQQNLNETLDEQTLFLDLNYRF